MRTAAQTAQRGTQGRPSTEDVTRLPPTNADRVKAILLGRRKELAHLFPKDGDAAVVRATVLAVDHARRLKSNVSPESIAECAVAALKLDLDSSEDCYFVPYNGKAKLIVGPQGLIKLGFRSGFVKSVVARYVLEGDLFEYELGSSEFIRHKRGETRPTRPLDIWNALIAAYCVIETTTGGKTIEVIERGGIDYFRSLSPSGSDDSGMWAKFPGEAARKAVLKQAFKFVPHSSQMALALREDSASEGVEIPAEILERLGIGADGSQAQAAEPEQEQQAEPQGREGAEA